MHALRRGLADEGLYEVLEFESTLEILDRQGKRARFRKRQKVRHRQHDIIAYQDQGWSNGESLPDYRCPPGGVVDQYRPNSYRADYSPAPFLFQEIAQRRSKQNIRRIAASAGGTAASGLRCRRIRQGSSLTSVSAAVRSSC